MGLAASQVLQQSPHCLAGTSAGDSKVKSLLISKLEAFSREDREYWSFRRRSDWDTLMDFCQYPGMMVPTMQGCLIGVACEVDPGVKWVLDPYVGSGTTLGEAIRRGLSFVGQDINPLAVLLCRAKTIPFHYDAVKAASDAVTDRIKSDSGRGIDVSFFGRDKWFQESVAQGLSKIRRAIALEQDLEIRRFLWVVLAETVRQTSNSRTSTYKLHIRPKKEIEGRSVSTVDTFDSVLSRNLENFREVSDRLETSGMLTDSHRCRSSVRVELGDTMASVPVCGAQSGYDLLITSPPYGDNATTVPYGQFSYLPLQWIPLHEIGPDADASFVSTTHEIDRRSLGGSKKGALDGLPQLEERSPGVTELKALLDGKPKDRLARVAAYLRDIDRSLDPILGSLRPGALMFWTIGNRRVGGVQIPTDRVLRELLESRGAVFVTQIDRKIPTKRMATRNSITQTIGREQILVLRKGATNA